VANNRVVWLGANDPPEAFPPIQDALTEPDGLLAAGGDLSEERLLYAYRHGIFPWYDEGQPILWWSPDPRCVLKLSDYHVARRLRRQICASTAELTFNRSFADVVRACAGPRRSQQDTWITDDMFAAYQALHASGWAHSIEIREDDRLIGGVYGLAIGRVFFGESMYSATPNASKLALLGLCQILKKHAFELIDCQVVSQHLLTLGATTISRSAFAAVLVEACNPATAFENWPNGPISMQELGSI